MSAIFISYRRSDAEGQAGRLFKDLGESFGTAAVFMDVADIQPGRDFRKVIDQQVATCGVLLVLIGRDWLDAKGEDGQRRIDDPNDFVRLETAAALRRDIPVVPVLVQGAVMPRAEQLPAELSELAFRNAVELTHPRWDSDVEVLIKALRAIVQPSASPGSAAPDVAPAGNAAAAGHAAPESAARKSGASFSKPLLGAGALGLVLMVGAYVAGQKTTAPPKAPGVAAADVTAAPDAAGSPPPPAPAAPQANAGSAAAATDATPAKRPLAQASAPAPHPHVSAPPAVAPVQSGTTTAQPPTPAVASVAQDAPPASIPAAPQTSGAFPDPGNSPPAFASAPLRATYPATLFLQDPCNGQRLQAGGMLQVAITRGPAGVQVQEQFDGSTLGYAVHLRGQGLFAQAMASYDVPFTGEWIGAGLRYGAHVGSRGVDRVFTSPIGAPIGDRVQALDSRCLSGNGR